MLLIPVKAEKAKRHHHQSSAQAAHHSHKETFCPWEGTKKQLIEALTCPQPFSVKDKVTAMALVPGKLIPDSSPSLLRVP